MFTEMFTENIYICNLNALVNDSAAWAVLSCSVMSDSLRPHGLQPTRLLCPWKFSRLEYWSELPCHPSEELPDPGIKPESPALRADFLLAELPGKLSDYC